MDVNSFQNQLHFIEGNSFEGQPLSSVHSSTERNSCGEHNRDGIKPLPTGEFSFDLGLVGSSRENILELSLSEFVSRVT